MVVAAGRGDRAAAPESPPKQFRSLAGKPVVMWSVEALIGAGCDPVIVVVPPDEVGRAHDRLGFSTEVTVTAGGVTRQASVMSGLEEVAAPKVLVHDAARPLVSRELIHRVVTALGSNRAVIPGVALEDTVKRTGDGLVVETVDRSTLIATQTPQGFETDLLRGLHEDARRDGLDVTDDAGLAEHYGVEVAVVEGERSNLKVTYPGDLALAEALLGSAAR